MKKYRVAILIALAGLLLFACGGREKANYSLPSETSQELCFGKTLYQERASNQFYGPLSSWVKRHPEAIVIAVLRIDSTSVVITYCE